MADNIIKVTPEELKNQSDLMFQLREEYISARKSVIADLEKVNISWSEKLSHNFVGKINNAKRCFVKIEDSLDIGAKVAAKCAESYESVDSALAKYMVDGDADALADVVSGVSAKVKGKSAVSFGEKVWDWCVGASSAVVTTISNSVAWWVDEYQNKSWVYQTVQYGKAALKIAGAGVKMFGAICTASTPVGLVLFASACNDVHSASCDIGYIYTKQYEKIGTENYLKNLLIDKGRETGEILFGNAEIGENIGNAIYWGIDALVLLNGAEKMLKSWGKVEAIRTGSKVDSDIFGKVSMSDMNEGFSIGPKDILSGPKDVAKEYIASKIFGDGSIESFYNKGQSGLARFAFDAIDKSYSTLKKAYKLGEKVKDILFG